LKISGKTCSLLFTLILLVSSCTSPKIALNTQKVTINELLDFIDAEQNKIVTLQASCRISVDSEEFSGNFFASVYYTQNDSLLISVSGPFGIQAGTLFIGEERFIFYNQMTNKFFNGSIKDFEDKNFFQFPLKMTELVHIFAAKEKLPSMKIKEYIIDDGSYLINSNNSEDDYSIWIDNSMGRITKITKTSDDKSTTTREYGNFFHSNDVYFPRKINMIRPEKKQAVSVFYTRIMLNKAIDPEDFVIKISDLAEQMNYLP
jgi:hypothetical protein